MPQVNTKNKFPHFQSFKKLPGSVWQGNFIKPWKIKKGNVSLILGNTTCTYSKVFVGQIPHYFRYANYSIHLFITQRAKCLNVHQLRDNRWLECITLTMASCKHTIFCQGELEFWSQYYKWVATEAPVTTAMEFFLQYICKEILWVSRPTKRPWFPGKRYSSISIWIIVCAAGSRGIQVLSCWDHWLPYF